MSDITLEQLQEVLGKSTADLNDRLKSLQQSQTKSLTGVLNKVLGQNSASIKQYEEILSNKFNDLIASIKDLTKESTIAEQSKASNESKAPSLPAEVSKNSSTDGKTNLLDAVKPVTLSTSINNSTKAIPVRVIEALNLKKVKEIDTRHKNEINIDIPPETRVWLENLLFDNFKDFTDELFERKGGLYDLYGAVHDVDKLLASGKLGGGNKKEDEGWLSKLLKSLGIAELLGPLEAIAAALTTAAAFFGGMKAVGGFGGARFAKALAKKNEPKTVEGDTESKKAKSKTETEDALAKAKEKIAQKEIEFDERNQKINEQIEQLNEDLLAKRQVAAKADQAKADAGKNYAESERMRQKALTEAEEKSIKAKNTQADIDIQAAEDAKITAKDAATKATKANVRYQEMYKKYEDAWSERYDIEQKIKTLEADQLKTIDEHNAEIKNIKEGKSTEPLGEKTKATLPEKAVEAADIGKSAEAAAGAAKNAAKAAEAVAKISKVAKIGGAVSVIAGAGVEAYEGSKEFKQIDADLKAKKITEEEARKKKEDVVGGRAGSFAATTGGALAGGIAAGEVGAALGLLTGPAAVVVSPLLALGFGVAGAMFGEKAIKATKLDKIASEVGKKVSEGIGEFNHKSKDVVEDQDPSHLGGFGNTVKGEKDFMPKSEDKSIKPAEQKPQIMPVEPVDQYKKVFENKQDKKDNNADSLEDTIAKQNDEFNRNMLKIINPLIGQLKETVVVLKQPIQGKSGNAIVSTSSNTTNIISGPGTSSMFRGSALDR